MFIGALVSFPQKGLVEDICDEGASAWMYVFSVADDCIMVKCLLVCVGLWRCCGISAIQSHCAAKIVYHTRDTIYSTAMEHDNAVFCYVLYGMMMNGVYMDHNGNKPTGPFCVILCYSPIETVSAGCVDVFSLFLQQSAKGDWRLSDRTWPASPISQQQA